MTPRKFAIIAVSAAAALGGCASDNQLQTASVSGPTNTAAKVDPACVALANRIDDLRNEGTVGRLEQAASGKSKNVQVKRTALAKQAELNQANADFQAKCGPKIPRATTAQVTPQTTTTASPTTQTAAAAPPRPQN